MKPSNVLFTDSGCLKLADFGSCKYSPSGPQNYTNLSSLPSNSCAPVDSGEESDGFYNLEEEEETDQLTGQFGNRCYKPPEALLGLDYDCKVDLWATGIIFIQLRHQKLPFKEPTDIRQLFRIFDVLGSPSASNWPEYDQATKGRQLFTFSPHEGWNEDSLDHLLGLNSLQRDTKVNARSLTRQLLSIGPSRRISAARVSSCCRVFIVITIDLAF